MLIHTTLGYQKLRLAEDFEMLRPTSNFEMLRLRLISKHRVRCLQDASQT